MAPFGSLLGALGLPLAPSGRRWGPFGTPLAPFGCPLNPLGRSVGLAGAKQKLGRFWGGSERSSTVNRYTNCPFWAQPQIPRISRIPRKRCQELRLGTPLPRAPGVRMTGVHKLPQTSLLRVSGYEEGGFGTLGFSSTFLRRFKFLLV